jgi:high frequency lysogenization protein
MPHTDYDRVIALAALFQATRMVRDIAHEGQAENSDFETCLTSLVKIDAPNSEVIYGGVNKLHSGLCLLNDHLVQPKDMEITRYVVGLLVLERKLAKQPQLLQQIRQGIEDCIEKLSYFPLTHNNIVASLADIYSSNISILKPRILVRGEPNHLTQPSNANRIRALLLAGIRAAILWRQSGGGRWTLLFKRKALLAQSQRILAKLDE